MSKHPLDHDRGESTGRMANFAAAEKADRPSSATKDLQQRARTQGEGKLRAYTRIEKTGTAA